MQQDKSRFSGKVVIVTGASGGLGVVISRMLAAQGAAVVLTDVAKDAGEAAAASIRQAGGEARFIPLDVTSAASWSRVMKAVQKMHGQLHGLINNAGLASRTGVNSMSIEEWRRVIDVNMTGPVLGIQAAAPLMRDAGGGSIVNVSSMAGLVAHKGMAYTASKWGLRGVTKSAALELLDWGIRVNSVHPAQIGGTALTASATPGYQYANDRSLPMKRAARMEEVAQAVLFLASDEASYINATELVVDGGTVALGLPRIRILLENDYNEAHAPRAVEGTGKASKAAKVATSKTAGTTKTNKSTSPAKPSKPSRIGR